MASARLSHVETMVFYELTMQGSCFFLTTWHIDRRTHRSSSVGTVVWYVFQHKQMHSSYGNRIEKRAYTCALLQLRPGRNDAAAIVSYELKLQGSCLENKFTVATWHVDRRTHWLSSVGTVVLYVFWHKQTHSSYDNRIEHKALKRALFTLLQSKSEQVGKHTCERTKLHSYCSLS